MTGVCRQGVMSCAFLSKPYQDVEAKADWRWMMYRFPGGLKERPVKDEFQRDPGMILWRAVNGMLPKNKLRGVRYLHFFGDQMHKQ